MKPIKIQIEEDNHNWIDEKDCFNSGFNKGYELAKKECKEMFDDYNEKLKEEIIEDYNSTPEDFEASKMRKIIDKLSKEVLGE